MSKRINAKILTRSDTSENWSLNNPILGKGEVGFDTTVGKHKIGDGETPWQNLDYFALESDLFNKVNFYIDTTAGWAQKTNLISTLGVLYIYSDRETIVRDNKTIKVAGIKIGDGSAYVVDLPFITVTQAERDFWNNKVRCYIDDITLTEAENLIFTTH